MRDERGGAWSLFVSDIGWAFCACSRAPRVPALWVLVTLLVSIDVGPFGIILLPLLIFGAGLTGAVRLSFAGLREGQGSMPFAGVWSAVGVYLNRFICLGLAISLIMTPVFVVTFLIDDGGTFFIVSTTVAVAIIDVLATFVPPALALSTWRMTEGVRLGWRVLRHGWSQHRWHALLPPLAVQALALTGLRDQPRLVQVPVMLASALVGIVLRGATVAAYLRAMPVSEDGPSWLDGRPKLEVRR